MQLLTIGEMAKLNHISTQTLRLYEKLGLISPDHVNPENGYRYYSVKQSARLDSIRHMKSLGMALHDISGLFEQNDISLLKAALEHKSDQIDGQIHTLKYQKRALERTLESYERLEKMPPEGTVALEFIGTRYMYCVDSGINFYEYDIEVYEKILRELKEHLIESGLPQVYFCNAGTILKQAYLIQRRYQSSEVFVFVDREFSSQGQIRKAPPNMFLCIYCRRFERERDYIGRLLDAVEEKGYEIIGDYICETLAELPLFDEEERGMYLRLQVPVAFHAPKKQD